MSSSDFQWMTGFECSAFPQVGADELEATQHYRWWASDLVRLRDVGFTMIRYGIPWHLVNPKPHVYDWDWVDQAVDLMAVLGITPIVDLFHYGTPPWIEGGIMHPIFGEMQSWYAKAFAEQYPQLLYYTPTNEPYICATFGAEWAIWYPFLRGQKNAARAIKNVAEGVARSMAEIRRVQPDALMMIADTCEYYHSVDGAFKEEAEFRSERRFIVHDLYQGLVNRDHPMWDYLVSNEIADWELHWFLENPVRLDILGCDYYAHSEHQLRRGPNGERLDETAENQFGWAEMARQYSERYGGIPVFLAETNKGGPVEQRIEWMEALVEETRKARAAGTAVAGFTYYGAIDHVDWDSALRVRNLNINPCAIWALEWQGNKLVRVPTELVECFRRYIALPVEESAGPIASEEAAARIRNVLEPAKNQLVSGVR
ncbi:MAG TPA: family 1 glycosylhydrolase [Ardenticatenaceae bacterium]|nr:family 1 glycosylhydrolase [Ardenticatenaceae bacterium]